MKRSAFSLQGDDCRAVYHTPEQFDDLIIQSNGELLTGLKFINTEDPYVITECKSSSISAIDMTALWLDRYFSGKEPPAFSLSAISSGSTFCCRVWMLLEGIPYGTSITYGQLARLYEARYGCAGMSAQAIGNAVSKNPLHIIIPCHRVLGVKGTLTGYAGGLNNKAALLDLEGISYKNDFRMKY